MMRTMTALLATTILASTGFCPARADYVNFAFLDSGLSGSGVLVVQANSASVGGYSVLSGALSVYGDPSVGTATLVANSKGTGVNTAPGTSSSFGSFDDQIFPGGTPLVDTYGLLFTSGVNDIFLYNSGTTTTPNYGYFDYNLKTGGYISIANVQLLVTAVQSGTPPPVPSAAVPEPSSLTLCGIAGVAGLGVARARRRRRVA